MKAFIGHSFSEEDESLVKKLKEYLESFDINCKTGEPAQNSSVAVKIKERIEESDVFFGLFTVDKEIRAEKDGETNSSINTKRSFTTSNWVIQESGFALGRDKEIIMIVEEGIYKIPQLQGDLEIIYFKRDSFERDIFLKLNQMINKLKGPKPIGTTTEIQERPLAIENDTEEIVSQHPKNVIDENEQRAIRVKYIDAMKNRNYAALQKIYSEELESTLKPEEKPAWEAMTYKLSHEYGDNLAFEKLLNIVDRNKDNPKVLIQLAYRYEDIEEYQKAKNLFLETAKLYDKNDESKKDYIVHCYEHASQCLARDKEYPTALELQINLYNDPEFQNQKEKILKSLARISEMNNDTDNFFFFSEAYLSLHPVDTNLRFDLAYKYSNDKHEGLALLHYKKLLNVEESLAARNNLGVAYAELGIVSKSVDSYFKAADKDESLAMANLAYKYIGAGFMKDATSLINKANSLASKNIHVHQNIGLARAELEKIIADENKKEEEILNKSEEERKFRVKFALSLPRKVQIDKTLIEGDWNTRNGTINIKMTDDTNIGFKASGETIIKKGGILKTLIETESNREFKETHKIVTSIKGTLDNLTGKYKINIEEVTEYENLSPNRESKYKAKGYMFIDESYKRIDIMEETTDENVEFDSWYKKQ